MSLVPCLNCCFAGLLVSRVIIVLKHPTTDTFWLKGLQPFGSRESSRTLAYSAEVIFLASFPCLFLKLVFIFAAASHFVHLGHPILGDASIHIQHHSMVWGVCLPLLSFLYPFHVPHLASRVPETELLLSENMTWLQFLDLLAYKTAAFLQWWKLSTA